MSDSFGENLLLSLEFYVPAISLSTKHDLSCVLLVRCWNLSCVETEDMTSPCVVGRRGFIVDLRKNSQRQLEESRAQRERSRLVPARAFCEGEIAENRD